MNDFQIILSVFLILVLFFVSFRLIGSMYKCSFTNQAGDIITIENECNEIESVQIISLDTYNCQYNCLDGQGNIVKIEI